MEDSAIAESWCRGGEIYSRLIDLGLVLVRFSKEAFVGAIEAHELYTPAADDGN